MQLERLNGRRAANGADGDAARTGRVATLPRPAPDSFDEHEHAYAGDRLEHDESDATLRESERLFRTTFERAVIGIAHTSPEGQWLRVNQWLCDLLGYTPEEMAARTFQDVTHPDDVAASVACLQGLMAGEQDADEFDKRYIRKDGALVWVHLTITLVRTSQGKPDYFITMVQDITERKRLEDERARLLEWERTARWEMETTNAQLQALQALTDAALSHLGLDDLLGELLDRVKVVLRVDHVAILLLDDDGQTLTVRAARGLLEAGVGRVEIPLGQAFAGHIAASREPLIVDNLCANDFTGVGVQMREQMRSLAGVPLLVQDPVEDHLVSRLVGALVVCSATARRFTECDIQLLQRAADRIAVAVDRARLYAAEQDARRQAEAALARAQASEAQVAARAEELRTVLETIADGVALYDAEGGLQLVNGAYRELHAMERGPAEFDALPSCERVRMLNMRDGTTGARLSAEDIPAGRALRGEVVTGPGADVRLRAFDGRELEVNASAAPLRQPDGRIAGAVVVVRDLTERNRLAREREAARADELAANEASRRLEQFLAVAVHDLRAPLTGVVGYLDLAARHTERLGSAVRETCPGLAPGVETVRQRLDDAGQGAERLTRLFSLLFDTSASRAGKLELRRAPADLATLLREQVNALRVAAPDRTIRLHLPRDGAPVPVEVDADRIGQVIANYVTNALKYSPPDRPVDLSLAARGDQAGVARVTVHDRGQGIPEAEQARVWELFHRASGAATQGGAPGGRLGGSLGLGLYICRAIVEAHGGRVGVESTLGEGSTFWFTLPLSSPPAS